MYDSPPPTIVQLRGLLAALIVDTRLVTDPVSVVLELDRCVRLCDWLTQQHPELMRGADGRVYLPEVHDGVSSRPAQE